MKQYEVCRRIINKLLNGEMKRKFHYYDYVFYLNPIQYLTNREFQSDYGVIEIVSVNIKNTITMYQKDRLALDLKNCLNNIIPYVEGMSYMRISKVKIKMNQRVCSGIIDPIAPSRRQ
jgi:hypothetical protein